MVFRVRMVVSEEERRVWVWEEMEETEEEREEVRELSELSESIEAVLREEMEEDRLVEVAVRESSVRWRESEVLVIES